MGFRKERKQYRLVFKDPELEGFMCLCKSLTVDEFMEVTSLASSFRDPKDNDTRKITKTFDILGDAIIEWNLEDDDGNPIAPDSKSLRQLEFDFVMEIMMAWMMAQSGVPSPLLTGSRNGEISQEDITEQLANLSRSHQS
jgi:hypothetical protein